MRYLIPILLLLAACQGDRAVNKGLSSHHWGLFKIAAKMEGVDTTTHGDPWDWTVRYAPNFHHIGNSHHDDFGLGLCEIKVNINKLIKCPIGGANQHLISVFRHEVKHCKGAKHSKNPRKLMYIVTPCWPVD